MSGIVHNFEKYPGGWNRINVCIGHLLMYQEDINLIKIHQKF